MTNNNRVIHTFFSLLKTETESKYMHKIHDI